MAQQHPLLWSLSPKVWKELANSVRRPQLALSSPAICQRQTRIHFTDGELIGDMTTFKTTDFRKRTSATHAPEPEEGSGHGGGDMGLIRAFVQAVKDGNKESLGQGMSIDDVLLAHLVVFAAEKSRRDGTVIDVVKFEKELRDVQRHR